MTKYNLTDYPEYDFFTYSLFYSYLCEQLKDGDTFVEIGSWLGQSTIFVANKIKQKKLNVKFYTIDFFDNHHDEECKLDVVVEKKIHDTFLDNIEPVKEYITSINGDSTEVYKQFEDESIDIIFIDGDHSHEGFIKDIKLWYPKVKTGGIVSGHDYIWGGNGVKPIIDSFSGFKARPYISGDVWFYKK